MLSTIKKCEIRRLESEVDVVCLATSFCRKGCLSKQSSECIEGPCVQGSEQLHRGGGKPGEEGIEFSACRKVDVAGLG